MLLLFTVSSKKRARNEDFSYKSDGFSDQMAKYMLIQSPLAFPKCTVGCRLYHDDKFLYFFSFSGVHLKILLPAETSLVKW